MDAKATTSSKVKRVAVQDLHRRDTDDTGVKQMLIVTSDGTRWNLE